MSTPKPLAALAFSLAWSAAAAQSPGLGARISEADIAAWDISILPDGTGLPAGSGTAAQGAPIFAAKCAMCHGEAGKGSPAGNVLVGGAPLAGAIETTKTIGNFWGYSTTVFDFIRRAMPFQRGRSTDNEVYALTAYLLALNKIIGENEVDERQDPAAGEDAQPRRLHHPLPDRIWHGRPQGVDPGRDRVRRLQPARFRPRADRQAGPARGAGERQAGENDRRARARRHPRGDGPDGNEGFAAVARHGRRTASRHGRAGHRHGGAQHQPHLVQGRTRPGPGRDQAPEREARGAVRGAAGPLRRVRDRRPSASRPRRAATRGRREEARLARRLGRDKRRRTGSGRSKVPSVLGQGRAARLPHFHAPTGTVVSRRDWAATAD